MAEKKYHVCAQVISAYTFPIRSTSKKKAIAKAKELLKNEELQLSDGNCAYGETHELYAFEAFIDDDIDDSECF